MPIPGLSSGFKVALLARTEEAGLNASASAYQCLFDGWWLRFSPGKAKRARCITAWAPGHLPLADKLHRCRRLYEEAGLPFLLRITPFTQPASLDAALASAGLVRFDDTRVLVLGDLAAVGELPPRTDLALEPIDSTSFAFAVGGLRGSPLDQQQAQAERLQTAIIPFEAWVLRREGQVIACGQLMLDDDLVGLYDVYTAAFARGQGLAAHLCRHLLARARVRGARAAYLQVDADNGPALAVYRRLGFQDAYGYHYRAWPDSAR